MSGCRSSEWTARSWCRAEGSPIRPPLVIAVSALVLVLSAAPALAAASFAEDTGRAEPSTEGHQVRMVVSEEDSVGRTETIEVVAPEGFAITACEVDQVRWGCDVDGRTVTYTRRVALQLGDFWFTVTTPSTPGTYRFIVTQSASPEDAGQEEGGEEAEDEQAAVVTSRPTFTVLGEAPSPTPSPQPTSPAPSPSPPPTTADSATDGSDGAAPDDDAPDDPSGTSTSDEDEQEPTSTEDDPAEASDRGSSGGSTAPTRTQGRSRGTTLEVMPGEPGDSAGAAAAPGVADDPAIAPPPSDGTQPGAAVDADTVAAGQEPAQQPRSDQVPWQQLVGAALLLVGGAVAILRRFDVMALARDLDPIIRLRGLEPLDRLRRWRNR